MLSQRMQDALNEQIAKELQAAHLYLAMCAYFQRANLPGFAHWMRVQSGEETAHALKLFEHVLDRGGKVELGAIEKPPAEFGSPLDAFQQVLAHERRVTEMIQRLYKAADDESDYATQVLLQWFIVEQIEEERAADQIMQRLRMAGDQGTVLLLLDRDLAARVTED